MILIYLLKVLSFSINAFVHSNKPVFQTVFKINFRQTVKGLFESSYYFIVVLEPNTTELFLQFRKQEEIART